MKDRIHLTFPRERIAEPVVCTVAKRFDVVFSIRRANVEAGSGWMDLEIDGEEAEIQRVVKFLEETGIRVDPVEGDIIAG
jgi:ABC-type methionine transport system ATPase subunit